MKIIIIFIISLVSLTSFGQKQKIRPVLWFGPADNILVCGINIAPVVFKLPKNSDVNGINIEGIGIATAFTLFPAGNTADELERLKVRGNFDVNGICVSAGGIFQEGTVNGLAVTPLVSCVDRVNGLNINLFSSSIQELNGLGFSVIGNFTFKTNGLQICVLQNRTNILKGVQIGFINLSKSTKGIQIGLWNINEHRQLPFINWSW